MTTHKLPLGYTYSGTENGAHAFLASTHTVGIPRKALFAKRLPNSAGRYGIVLKYIYGVPQVDGSIAMAMNTSDYRLVPNMASGDFTALAQGVKDIGSPGNVATFGSEWLKMGVIPSSQSDVAIA